MLKYFKNVINFGVSPEDGFYDAGIKRTLNILAVNTIACIIAATLIDFAIKKDPAAFYVWLAIPFQILTIYCNKWNKSHIGVTLMFVAGNVLLAIYCLITGEESYKHVLFSLSIIALAILYRKGALRIYYWVNLIFTVACLVFVLACFEYGWFAGLRDPNINVQQERQLNLLFIISCAIIFSIVVVNSFARQYNRLKKALDEKDVLLAELNHRVKNNLTVIVSLMRIKEEMSKSKETKEALKEIRNRIYSMAIVHQKMYEGKGKSFSYAPEFFNELIEGLMKSIDSDRKITIHKNIEELKLTMYQAIPLGMILNELITNSVKHAFNDQEKPEIELSYSEDGEGRIKLTYEDNGTGMINAGQPREGSLGMELINSLANQMDSEFRFYNNHGFGFELTFAKETE